MKSSDGSLDPEQEAAAHSAEDAHEEHDTEDIDNAEDEDTEEECPSPVGAKRKRDSKESSSGIDEDESHKPLPAFITKTFNMINEESHFDVISWNPKGDGFVVKNEHEFAQNILPKYFKHRNFSSFVRQLNLYGFHKYAHDSLKIEFKHVSFRKGRLDLLHLIKRKPGASSSMYFYPKKASDGISNRFVFRC